MAKQTAVDSLKESIRLLEIKQTEEGKILKEQFKITYESLKLVNLVKNSLKELTSSAEVKTRFFETIVSMLTGCLTKKIMVSSKSNIFAKLIGVFLQFGVTTVVAKNADSILNLITDLVERFLHPEKAKVSETEIPEAEV